MSTEMNIENDQITLINQITSLEVFTDRETVNKIIEAHEIELRAFVPDVSTSKGRAEIASFAYKFRKSKTAFDTAGKRFAEDAKRLVDSVNAERKRFRDECDRMADEARRPLDEWEAEQARKEAEIAGFIQHIKNFSDPAIISTFTAEQIRNNLESCKSYPVDSAFGDWEQSAATEKANSIAKLVIALDAKVQAEKDAAEFEILRKEREQREAKEAAEKAAKEEAERIAAKKAAEAAEKARIEQEARDKAIAEAKEREEKLIAEKYAAEQAAKEAAAKAEQNRITRIKELIADLSNQASPSRSGRYSSEFLTKQIELVEDFKIDGRFDELADEAASVKSNVLKSLDAQLKQALEHEAKERDEIERQKAEAEQAKLDKIKAADDARKADDAHRNKIDLEIYEALVNFLGDEIEDHGKLRYLVDKIGDGDIPHVSINY